MAGGVHFPLEIMILILMTSSCFYYVIKFTTCMFLPARASEQGNVIESVRIYITEKPFTSK